MAGCHRSCITKRKFGLSVGLHAQPWPKRHGSQAQPKPTHDRHNARTLSCHLERRPPSYTSLKVKDLALSTHRATDTHTFCMATWRSVRPACWSGVGRAMELCEAAKSNARRVDQSPSAAGGEVWVLCARTRWLATRVAWVSSAECQVAHGTGHGGTHMHWTVWTGRAVGKAFFGSVPVCNTWS